MIINVGGVDPDRFLSIEALLESDLGFNRLRLVGRLRILWLDLILGFEPGGSERGV